MMIAFMVLFFPSVLATAIYEGLEKTSLGRKQWLYRYCTNTLFINLFCFLVKQVVLGTADAPLYVSGIDMSPHAALNYLIMAIPTAVVFSFLQVLLNKHVKTEVTEIEEKE